MRVFDQDSNPDRRPSVLPSVKVVLGFLLLLAMLSQSSLDPGPLNLLQPADGIGNWFGMPGALAAGFLLELLGAGGFLVPLSLLFLKHDDSLRLQQIILLDITMVVMLSIGLAQLFSVNDGSSIRLSGLLGEMSTIYLQAFPGKLVCLLVVGGLAVEYHSRYRFNPQSIVLVTQLAGIVAASATILRTAAASCWNRLGWQMDGYLSPAATITKGHLASLRARAVEGWKTASEKSASWFFELSSFNRFFSSQLDISAPGHLREKEIRELEQRKLLSRTIEEYERRAPGEG